MGAATVLSYGYDDLCFRPVHAPATLARNLPLRLSVLGHAIPFLSDTEVPAWHLADNLRLLSVCIT